MGREWDRPAAIYWKMPDIKPGKYYLGLWQETQGKPYNLPPTDPRISEYWPEKLLTCAYLNGFPVRFASTSDPVQVKPGILLAELQTGEAVELKPGDELAVRGLNGNCVFLRLALYRQPPQRGHGVTGQTFGRTFSCPRPFPQLRLAVQPQITGSGEPGTKHEVRIKIANPLPYAVQAVVDWKLADYFGKLEVKSSKVYDLAPHAMIADVFPFTAESDEPTSWT